MPKGNPPAPKKPRRDAVRSAAGDEANKNAMPGRIKRVGSGPVDSLMGAGQDKYGKGGAGMGKGRGQVRGSQAQNQPTKNKAVKKTGVTKRKK